MVVIFAAVLFIPAGTIAWPAAWIFLALMFGFTVAISLWLVRNDPELLAERMSGIGKADQKTWDKILLAITAIALFAWLAVMGLDVMRYRWSHLSIGFQAFGLSLLVLSLYLFFVTFRENSFLSPAVRIQRERAQRVISTGPYRYVRHPLYAGFVMFVFGASLMLASCYGLIGALVLTGIVIIRAVLEEQVLRRDLSGYAAYMRRVKYRFIPHLW
jgi:protein-S-isoprenylcysteine O-methyltransferase Ste14